MILFELSRDGLRDNVVHSKHVGGRLSSITPETLILPPPPFTLVPHPWDDYSLIFVLSGSSFVSGFGLTHVSREL